MILQRKRAVFQLIFTSPAFAGKNNSVDAPASRLERQMTHKSSTCCQRMAAVFSARDPRPAAG
jgi:hypothetical protein